MNTRNSTPNQATAHHIRQHNMATSYALDSTMSLSHTHAHENRQVHMRFIDQLQQLSVVLSPPSMVSLPLTLSLACSSPPSLSLARARARSLSLAHLLCFFPWLARWLSHVPYFSHVHVLSLFLSLSFSVCVTRKRKREGACSLIHTFSCSPPLISLYLNPLLLWFVSVYHPHRD